MKPAIIATLLAAAGSASAGEKPPATATADADAVFVTATGATCCAGCACCSARGDGASGATMKKRIVIDGPGGAAFVGTGKGKDGPHAYQVIIEDGQAKVIEIDPDDDSKNGFSVDMHDGDFDWTQLGPAFRFRMGGNDDDATDADGDRPRLGVMLADGDDGLTIEDVMDGYPAEEAGLESGDVILSINGAGPASLERLRKALGASEVTLVILRDGDKKTVTVELSDDDDGPRWRSAPGPDGAMHGRLRGLKGLHGLKGLKGLKGMHALELDDDTVEMLRKGLAEAEGAVKDFDFDFTIDTDSLHAAQEALRSALEGAKMPPEAREKLHAALSELRERRPGMAPGRAMMERQRATAEMERKRGGAMRERMHKQMRERERTEVESRARAPRSRDGHGVSGDIESRLKRLEERMERIETYLERLSQKG